jgi:hypothetical protein
MVGWMVVWMDGQMDRSMDGCIYMYTYVYTCMFTCSLHLLIPGVFGPSTFLFPKVDLTEDPDWCFPENAGTWMFWKLGSGCLEVGMPLGEFQIAQYSESVSDQSLRIVFACFKEFWKEYPRCQQSIRNGSGRVLRIWNPWAWLKIDFRKWMGDDWFAKHNLKIDHVPELLFQNPTFFASNPHDRGYMVDQKMMSSWKWGSRTVHFKSQTQKVYRGQKKVYNTILKRNHSRPLALDPWPPRGGHSRPQVVDPIFVEQCMSCRLWITIRQLMAALLWSPARPASFNLATHLSVLVSFWWDY